MEIKIIRMNISDLKICDRVLLQSGSSVKEHAQVKAFLDNGNVLLRLSDGRIDEFDPQYILKNFGQP